MKIKQWQILGVAFSVVLGTLLHFTYQWSGKSVFIGIFSAINESTWEHLKLLYTPILLFGILEYFMYGKIIRNFIPVKASSILIGMIMIIVSFYTYVGIIGQNFLWLDILTFVLGVLASYWYSLFFLQTTYLCSNCAIRVGWVILVLLVLGFTLFTFSPPNIGLFSNPT